MGILDRLFGDREAHVADDRWIVVGLGNPESEYGGTRHNIGADAVRALAARLGTDFKPHKKAQALIADGWDTPGGTPVSHVIPFGYYNTAGGPVQQALAFYKVPAERLVVVHDDIDLEPGKLRIKRGGGNAGNKGLGSIQQRTGGSDFFRVRIGVGRPPGQMSAKDHVLRKFTRTEREEIDVVVERAGDAVLELISNGLEPAQNRHH